MNQEKKLGQPSANLVISGDEDQQAKDMMNQANQKRDDLESHDG